MPDMVNEDTCARQGLLRLHTIATGSQRVTTKTCALETAGCTLHENLSESSEFAYYR